MVQKQIKQLYSSQGLQGATGEEIKGDSGVAKAYEFDKLNKLLATKADNLEQTERDIAWLFGLWMDAEKVDYVVDYPEDFDVKSLAAEIQMAQELSILSVSDTFTKEIHKSIVKKVLPKMLDKTEEKILAEIDQASLEDDDAEKENRFPFDKENPKEKDSKKNGENKK